MRFLPNMHSDDNLQSVLPGTFPAQAGGMFYYFDGNANP